MTTPTAQLRIATELPINVDYFDSGNETDRADLESDLEDEVTGTVASYWANWEVIVLPRDHPYESEVLDEIEDRIDLVLSPYELRVKGATPTPLRIRYVWRRGRRIRVHSYALEIDRDDANGWVDWTITHGGNVVAFMAELSWEMSV